jgi:hypothetical protein
MINRDQLKANYGVVTDKILVILETMSADFWQQKEQGDGSADKLVQDLRQELQNEWQLKQDLLNLKEQELQNAPETDKQYLAKLKKLWTNKNTLLSVIFGAKDSPFNFEWSRANESWTNNLYGLKEALPIKSKGFINNLKIYFEQSQREFEYN